MQQHPLLQTFADASSRFREKARVVTHPAEHAQDVSRVGRRGIELQAPALGRVAHVHAEHSGAPAERALRGQGAARAPHPVQ